MFICLLLCGLCVKIFSEISEEVGLERAPDMHDKTKLNFLNATILETQRITIGPVR